MAGDTIITIIGNLTADPEMRFTPSGAAVASFTIASTPRIFDRQTNEWKDAETLFMRRGREHGAEVKNVPLDVNVRSGSITVTSADFAPGLYVYKLIANGVLLGFKKFISK